MALGVEGMMLLEVGGDKGSGGGGGGACQSPPLMKSP